MSQAASSKQNYLKRQLNKISRKDNESVVRDDYSREQLNMTMFSSHNNTQNAANLSKTKMNTSTLKKNSYQEPNAKKPFKRKKQNTIKANSFAIDHKDRDAFNIDDVSDKNLLNATDNKKKTLVKEYKGEDTQINEKAFMKKAPVNIFNIKNYNILKSENSKRENSMKDQSNPAARKGVIVKNKSGSPKMDHKIHNFFVFIGNKESNGQKSKVNNNSMNSNTPNRNKQKKVRTVDETINDDKYVKLANIMKKDNSGFDAYQNPEDRKIQIPNHIKQVLRRKDRNESTFFKNEAIPFSEQADALKKQQVNLRAVVEQAKEEPEITKTLDTFGEQKMDNGNTCSTSQRNLNLLRSAKEKLGDIFKEVGGVLRKFQSDKQNRIMKDMETQTEVKKNKEIVFANLNCMNLMKEMAKEILLKGKSVNNNIDNIPTHFQSLLPPESINDAELQNQIGSIMNYYQEQIIFEEALVILQEKGVDLENQFIYAYEKLKINMEDGNEDKKDENGEPSFTVVTDVSLQNISNFDSVLEQKDIESQDLDPKFELNLVDIHVEEESDNDDQ